VVKKAAGKRGAAMRKAQESQKKKQVGTVKSVAALMKELEGQTRRVMARIPCR